MIIRKVTRAYLTGQPCWISHIRPYESISLYRPGEPVDVLVFENCFPDKTFTKVTAKIVLDLCALPTSEIGLEAMAMSRLIVTHTQDLAEKFEEVSGKMVHVLQHVSLGIPPHDTSNPDGRCVLLDFWPHYHRCPVTVKPDTTHVVGDTLSCVFNRTLLPTVDCDESRRNLGAWLHRADFVYHDPFLLEQLMREKTNDEPIPELLERLING